MKSYFFLLFFIFIFSLPGTAVDLVELGKKEAERRKNTKRSVYSLNNKNLRTLNVSNTNYGFAVMKSKNQNTAQYYNKVINRARAGLKKKKRNSETGEEEITRPRQRNRSSSPYDPYYPGENYHHIVTPESSSRAYEIQASVKKIDALTVEIKKQEKVLETKPQVEMFPSIRKQKEKQWRNRIDRLNKLREAEQNRVSLLKPDNNPGYYRGSPGKTRGGSRTQPGYMGPRDNYRTNGAGGNGNSGSTGHTVSTGSTSGRTAGITSRPHRRTKVTSRNQAPRFRTNSHTIPGFRKKRK